MLSAFINLECFMANNLYTLPSCIRSGIDEPQQIIPTWCLRVTQMKRNQDIRKFALHLNSLERK